VVVASTRPAVVAPMQPAAAARAMRPRRVTDR
jgi:hypothetical protein